MAEGTLSSKRGNLRGVWRLARPGNLAIAAGTMVLLREGWLARWTTFPPPSGDDQALFIAGITVVVLLMSAGNLINAYFDVDEDRINRPHRALVDRVVKRRVLIIAHQVLNTMGLGVAGWMSVRTAHPIFLLTAIGISTMLWRYSARWKGRPMIGNIVVAGLLAAVPLWLCMMEWPRWAPQDRLSMGAALGIMALLAFCVGWQREVVKDALDAKGDEAAGKRTAAVHHGLDHARRTASLVAVLGILLYTLPMAWVATRASTLAAIGTGFPLMTLLVAFGALRQTDPRWSLADRLLKLALVLGFLQSLWLPAP